MIKVGSGFDVESALPSIVHYPFYSIPDDIIPDSFRGLESSLAIIKSFESQKRGLDLTSYRNKSFKKVAVIILKVLFCVCKFAPDLYKIYKQRDEPRTFLFIVGLVIFACYSLVVYWSSLYFENYAVFKRIYDVNRELSFKLNEINESIDSSMIVKDEDRKLDIVTDSYAVYVGSKSAEVCLIHDEQKPEFENLVKLFNDYARLTHQYVENHKKLIQAKVI